MNGDSTIGTISGSGATSTDNVPTNEGSHVLAATSVSDPSKSAKAKVTVHLSSKISLVAVSPATLSLNTGVTNQFTATVSGTGRYSSGVTWTAQRGSISSTGLYTAPSTGGSDVVTATSMADATKSATSSVTVTVPTTITAVSVSPSTLSLNTSATNQFTSAVTGTGGYSSAVTWSAQRGSISSTGLYTRHPPQVAVMS